MTDEGAAGDTSACGTDHGRACGRVLGTAAAGGVWLRQNSIWQERRIIHDATEARRKEDEDEDDEERGPGCWRLIVVSGDKTEGQRCDSDLK